MQRSLMASVVLLFTSASMAQQGEWEQDFLYFGNDPQGADAIVAVHLIHLHTGKVLAITYGPPHDCNYPGGGRNYLWTPPPPNSPGNSGQFQSLPNCHNYMFCAGHSAMADGRILTWEQHFTDLN